MYTKETLCKYQYFNRLLEKADISYILDSLTKTISRQYFIDFVNDLINSQIPFTMGILDLDNFKFINDNYGHSVGDKVLKNVAKDLIAYLGEYGIVGRYGGDEFVFIYTKTNDYDEVHQLFLDMYYNNTVLRKDLVLETCVPFITGTIGSAAYPDNASNYKELFDMADKTLYRGKTKGRNCFIMYVESKHKDITVQKLAKEDIYITLYNMANIFEEPESLIEKLHNTYLYLVNLIKSNIYYVDKTGVMVDIKDNRLVTLNTDKLRKALGDDALFTSNFTTDKNIKDKAIKEALNFMPMTAVLITKIEKNHHSYGYLIVAEESIHRLWQNEETAIMFYFSKMIAAYLENK